MVLLDLMEKKIFESSFDKNDVKIDSVLSKFPTKIYTNLGSYESQNYKNKMKNFSRGRE